ncbi:MAG TPA: hypothetical protein VLA93_18995 [Pyrinomonadaceae bacterium]|nr:hypothetical protein [Pyrinomonadaceae bacterium]
MNFLGRRKFVSLIYRSTASLVAWPLLSRILLRSDAADASDLQNQAQPATSCWLDLCVPLVVQDEEQGLNSELVLTSDTFIGRDGYRDGRDTTEYRLFLYDADGSPLQLEFEKSNLMVPAMHTTVIPLADLIHPRKSFSGGLTIRLRPKGRESMHASDLFSSAFIRWQTATSFDNVHANPDPLQWQIRKPFHYSMPFPALSDYQCTVALFNPYDVHSVGHILLRDHAGANLIDRAYDLMPHSTLLVDLNRPDFNSDAYAAFGLKPPATNAVRIERTSSVKTVAPIDVQSKARDGGILVVTNNDSATKNFAYMLIRKHGNQRFSVEHPLHVTQPASKPSPSAVPFDTEGRFKARNVLYSPLLFRGKRIGPITLESRFHLSTGLPYEDTLWLAPFVVDQTGSVPWLASSDQKIVAQLHPSQWERNTIRLGNEQSCTLNFSRLSLPNDFAGGLCLPVAPDTAHTFMKVEVRVPEWEAHAFTHFRPGLRSARSYQKPQQRGGLMTDYLTAGARLQRRGEQILCDEFIGIINIDDRAVAGKPVLEVFGPKGLLKRVQLKSIAPFGCSHFLLSALLPESSYPFPLTMRLVDESATVLMSTVHLDYVRRDLALDHGSDRFSTFNDADCKAPA